EKVERIGLVAGSDRAVRDAAIDEVAVGRERNVAGVAVRGRHRPGVHAERLPDRLVARVHVGGGPAVLVALRVAADLVAVAHRARPDRIGELRSLAGDEVEGHSYAERLQLAVMLDLRRVRVVERIGDRGSEPGPVEYGQ